MKERHMLNCWKSLVAIAAFGSVTAASAQQVGSEQYRMDGLEVTVVSHAFLTDEEMMTLRLVGQNRDALSLFVPEGDGYAALAVAPSEGFVRAGEAVPSAIAMAGLPDINSARASALEACNAARQSGAECQIVLEIAPD